MGKRQRAKAGGWCSAEVAAERGSKTIYITPGSPWENPYIESFIGKLRDECLNQHLFGNLGEAREIVENWRQEHNEYRPHGSLEYRTPVEFAAEHQAEVAGNVVVEAVQEPALSLQVDEKLGGALMAGKNKKPYEGARITMARLRIGLLSKKRGNFAIQEKFIGAENVVDETHAEAEHHERALTEAGHSICQIHWGPNFINDLQASQVDLVFNVSSLVEAAILEELEIPYVGSDTFTIAIATDKSLAKRLWQQAGLPTSPFCVARSEKECEVFRDIPPFDYPLFVKPVAGRGSAGINDTSIVHSYSQLVSGVVERLETIGQPVLIEKFLRGREITLGVLGNEGARALPPLQIVYSDEDNTLTFEKKELDNDTFLCPAPLTAEEAHMIQQLALRAYQVLGFRDFGRIDTILTEEGPFLLEGNTFAGLMCTPKEKPRSYIGFMARAEGKDSKALLDEIIQIAIRRLNLKACD